MKSQAPNKEARKLTRGSQPAEMRSSSLLGENMILQALPRLARAIPSPMLSHLAAPLPPHTSWYRSRRLTPQLPKYLICPAEHASAPADPDRVAMEQSSNVCNTKPASTLDSSSREGILFHHSITQLLQVMNPPLANAVRAFLVSKAAEITC